MDQIGGDYANVLMNSSGSMGGDYANALMNSSASKGPSASKGLSASMGPSASMGLSASMGRVGVVSLHGDVPMMMPTAEVLASICIVDCDTEIRSLWRNVSNNLTQNTNFILTP
jgi:hypothetical protein